MASPGPKPRYPRIERPIAYRPHEKVGAVLKARAATANLTWSEYTEHLVATALGMPECAPRPQPNDSQESLIPDDLDT